MANFFNPFSGGGDPASLVSHASGLRSPIEALEDITGVTAAEAAAEGQALQEQFGREALDAQTQARLRLEETLAPFVGFGTDLIPQFEGLFGGDVASSIAGSPTLQGFNQFANEQVGANPFLASIDPSNIGQQQLINNIDLLSRERGDLLGALGIGQASAAQQAAGNVQTGARRADLLSQIGNIQAAGGIGQANALGQGASNVATFGTGLADIFRGRG